MSIEEPETRPDLKAADECSFRKLDFNAFPGMQQQFREWGKNRKVSGGDGEGRNASQWQPAEKGVCLMLELDRAGFA